MATPHRGAATAVAGALSAHLLAGAPVTAAINVELRPANQIVTIGLDDTVSVGLYFVSDDDTDQFTAAADIIIAWDPEFLQLLDLDGTGAPEEVFSSSFPANDVHGINEIVPPQDGDGLYVMWATPGSPVAATPQGTLITTFVFAPVKPTPTTGIGFLETAGDPPAFTTVFDGTIPNLDVTGTLTGASVEVLPCCPPDFNGDCVVNVQDFLILLAAWGSDPGGPPDLDGNGVVAINDFLILLAAWGPCP